LLLFQHRRLHRLQDRENYRTTTGFLPERLRVYTAWRRLLLSHNVLGVQVHDAHLAAVLEVHEVTHLLTFNGPDFKRFTNLIPVHPQEVEP
jgi:predicted nucleic acid-binding protein